LRPQQGNEDLCRQAPGGIVADRLLALRHAFVDRLWGGMFAIAVIGTPISIFRAYTTGWMHVYSLHIVLGLLASALYFGRRHIAYRAKLATLIGLFWAVGLSGIFTLGLMGSGVWFLVMSSLLSCIFYSARVGMATAAAATGVLVVAAALFIGGILAIPFDANAYAASVTGWVGLLTATAVMPFIVLAAFGTYQQTVVDLLQEIQQQRDRIAELADRDHLTGLPMTNLANDRLQIKLNAAVRAGEKVAVMFIDLNEFKEVNDSAGHEAGDYVLKAIAGRLKDSVRSEETVARVGGDEFLVILGNVKHPRDTIPVAEMIIDAVCRPVDFNGTQFAAGVSIGIAIFPDDATDIAGLRREADRAMYESKRSGRSGYIFAGRAASISEAFAAE
jgi:diguanylate cyclase (GGDEF)-like protein